MKKYVAYYRVSTKRQGASGLGLQAQQDTIKSCLADGQLIAEFIELESGKHDQRNELEMAIDLCRSEAAELIIAKLDRLSRNVSFIFKLKESGIPFKACDLPHFNTLTLGVFASFAQYEREQISERTRNALKKKVERDGEWRISQLTDADRLKAVAAIKAKSESNLNKKLALGYAVELRANGLTFDAIAARLNESGHKTSKGLTWTRGQVYRLIGC